MAHYLPPPLLALFRPRPPIEYAAQVDEKHKKPRPYTGLAAFVDRFKDPSELTPLVKHETSKEKKARRKLRAIKRGDYQASKHLETWDAQKNEKATEDPYKTLFVSRLDYTVTEDDLKKEFERCGPVKSVRVVTDTKSGKSRGYAFIEFVDTKDFKYAYKSMEGRRIGRKRFIVDVERGRTVPNWKPRSLGGGLGTTRNGERKKKGAQMMQEPPRRSSYSGDREGPRDDRRSSYSDRGRERDYRRSESFDKRRDSYGGERDRRSRGNYGSDAFSRRDGGGSSRRYDDRDDRYRR